MTDRRELEERLAELAARTNGHASGVVDRPSAELVMVDGGLDEDDVPEGCTSRTVEGPNGVTYEVVERIEEGGEP